MGEHLGSTLFHGYQTQGSKGTPATGSHLAFGAGAGEIDKNANLSQARFIGSAARAMFKGGGAVSALQFTADSWHSHLPLQLAVRSAGVLPWFTVSGGYDEASDKGWHTRDCKVDTLALKLGAGDAPGILSGSMTIIGHRTVENTAAEVVTNPTIPHDHAYECVATLNGSPFENIDFELNIRNNLKPTWVIAGAARTANEMRFWDYLTEGVLDVSGKVMALEPWGTDVHADTMGTGAGDLVLLLTNKVSGDIIRLTATAVYFGSQKQSNPTDGRHTYDLPFEAKNFAIANS